MRMYVLWEQCKRNRNRPTRVACPTCRIDALIGDASGYPITDRAFQIEFGKRWWGETPITRGDKPDSTGVVRIEVE
jgi:hypothetical protein